MKFSIQIFLALLFPYCLIGQDASTYNRNHRYWTEKEITVENFKADPINGSPFTSEIFVNLKFEHKAEMANGIEQRGYVASAFMTEDLSWIIADSSNVNRVLKYNQTIFNIAELYARKLQKEIELSLASEHDVNKLTNIHGEYLNQLTRKIRDFKSETKYGELSNIVDQWYARYQKRLQEFKRRPFDSYKLDNSSFGFTFGTGVGVMQGQIKESLQTSIDFLQYGFFVNHNRFYFDMNVSIGINRSKVDFSEAGFFFDEGDFIGSGRGFLSIGYEVYANKKINIYPLVGYGIYQLERTGFEEEFTDVNGPLNLVPSFGLNVDYRIKSLLNQNSRADFALNFRLSYEPIHYLETLNGGIISFKVGFGGIIEQISLIY